MYFDLIAERMEGSIEGRRFVGLLTVGDGSCALHAAFGEADIARCGGIFCRDARSMVSLLLPASFDELRHALDAQGHVHLSAWSGWETYIFRSVSRS